MKEYESKTVLITGACGTVGSELVDQLLSNSVKRVVCLDNNESELFFLYEKYKDTKKIDCHLADIRDLDSLKLRMQNVDIVLHTAALKHVGLCEDSPNQAVMTNILGTQNVIDAALANGVERVVFTSTDKAVNPTNVMGTSKLMGERLMTAASDSNPEKNTIFASTRFGNVLGSRGSVVPLFQRQIKNGGPITLTHSDMTRFIMTLSQAAELVLRSVWMARGGEVLVTKMPIAKIKDIASVMAKHYGVEDKIDIDEIGPKPGEKMYEELMNEEEVRRAHEYGDFFVILSAFVDPSHSTYQYLSGCSQPDRPYNSSHEDHMSEKEVEEYFSQYGVLD